ncbi:MAG: ROK family transcriptional regulator [Lentisphaeria bacterium]
MKKNPVQKNLLKLNDIKLRNTLSLLGVLMQHGRLSRVELAQALGCDNTTVTRAVRDLLSRNLVMTDGKTELQHGRPREQLVLNPDGAYLIGISLEPDRIGAALTDLNGHPRILERLHLGERRSLQEYLHALSEILQRLLQESSGRLAGVGVSTFGTSLAPEDGVLNDIANFPELKGFNLRDYFTENFNLSPVFADMMICRMHYELNRHPECRKGNTLLVHLGSGIGMSLASEGVIVLSRNQHGGELGHNICELDGLPCACGRHGCLETRCSTSILLKQPRIDGTSSDMTFRKFAEKYISGDVRAVQVVNDALKFLVVALANQINNLSPDTLILVGELMELGERFYIALEESVRALLFEYTSQALTFAFRSSEEWGAEGAALLAGSRLLTNPEAFNSACPKQ